MLEAAKVSLANLCASLQQSLAKLRELRRCWSDCQDSLVSMYPDYPLSADCGQALVQKEGEHCMVLHGLEGYPDVDFECFSSLRQEVCCQLVDLLVVLNDWGEPLCRRMLA